MSNSLKEISVGRRDVWILPRKFINIEEGFNVREDFGDLNSIAEFVIKHGAENLPPLMLRIGPDGKYYVTDGERRTRGIDLALSKGAKIKGVPVMMEPRGYTAFNRALSFVSRNAGKPLTILEQARSFNRGHDLGGTPKEIAAETGFSITHIKDGLSLFTAPDSVLKLVKKDKIKASLVIDLIRETKGDAEQLEKLVKEAVEAAEKDGKTQASRKHVKAPAGPSTSPESTGTDENQQGGPGAPADPSSDSTAGGNEVDQDPSTNPPAPIPSGSQQTDWSGVNSNPNPQTGGGGGGQTLSRDSTKNLEKLNKWMEKQNLDDFIPAQKDLIEALINYLEGSTDILPVKKLLLKKDVE